MILKIATLIIAIARCCFSFYNLGYLKGSEDERELKWPALSSLQAMIIHTRKTVNELRLKNLGVRAKTGK